MAHLGTFALAYSPWYCGAGVKGACGAGKESIMKKGGLVGTNSIKSDAATPTWRCG